MADPRFFSCKGPFSLHELCNVSEGNLHHTEDANKLFYNVAPLESATEKDISFLSNKKYRNGFLKSKAGACIIEKSEIEYVPPHMGIILSDNPYYAYAKIAALFYPEDNISSTITPNAVIHPSAVIDENVFIGQHVIIEENAIIGKNSCVGHNSVIGKGVIVGENCRIGVNVALSHAVIGNHVTLHNGVCIGQEGFGFATNKGQHVSIPQLGIVVIEDEANIGANTTIDRGSGPNTVIGRGTRIDNLVQIGHNVHIGKGCVIVAQAGISGSSKLGDYVVLGGQVGIAGHLTIGSGAKIAAQSGVLKSIPVSEMHGGSPSVPITQWHRQTIALKQLTEKKKETA